MLCQEQGGTLERVITYASRGLSSSERTYSAYKLTFLALKWGVTEKFHGYIYRNRFLVLTDNNTLTYVLTTAQIDSTGHRWLVDLQLYNFSIRYRPGRTNVDADLFSRLPKRITEETKLREGQRKRDAGEHAPEYQEICKRPSGLFVNQ